jgi:hypothetical protein
MSGIPTATLRVFEHEDTHLSTPENNIDAAKRPRTPKTHPPKPWGFTPEQLATHPTVYRDDLLHGKTFLVSGGGTGLGQDIAYLLSRLGANVMICGPRGRHLPLQDAVHRMVAAEEFRYSNPMKELGDVWPGLKPDYFQLNER